MVIKNEISEEKYIWNNRILTKYRRKIFTNQEGLIVVEIEQMPISSGTTITNTIDLIAQDTKTYLWNMYLDFQKKSKTNWLKKIIDCLATNLGDFLLNILKQIMFVFLDYFEYKKIINSIIWIEHYPPNVYFFTKDNYAVIEFERDFINPEWNHFTKKQLANEIKCEETLL